MFFATIVGRLGQDPATRATAKGDSVTTLSVATDHGFGDRKRTTWTRVAVFGKTADFCMAQLKKGGRVACAGSIYLDEWTDKEGAKRQTLCMDAREVEKVWDNDRSSGGGGEHEAPRGGGRQAAPDDDIPFCRTVSMRDRQ